MKTILGIDLGTQSIKTLFYNYEDQTIAALASAPLQLISRADGTSEQEAKWWIEGLKACLSKIPQPVKNSVQAIGVSGQQHGLVALDQSGQPVYPVKLWNDTSTGPECRQITEAFGGKEKLVREVGNPMLPGYTAPKILWLKKNQPHLYQNVKKILLPHDYLNYYLTGNWLAEYGDASGTGLLDIRQRTWSKKAAQTIGDEVIDLLPDLIDSLSCAGSLTRARAEELNLPPAIPISAGGGDNMMGAIGTGIISNGQLTISLGTSGTLYGYWDQPVIDPRGRIAAFCSSTGGWLPLLCTMNCTVATELIRKLFALEVSEIDSIVSRSPAGAEGVITIPFYHGERSPDLPDGKGCLLGLTAANMTAGNLLRSAMESVIMGMQEGIGVFMQHGFKPDRVCLIGGGAKSRQWRQIVADILNLSVDVPQISEAAAFGAALQALWVITNQHNSSSLTFSQLISEHLSSIEIDQYEPRADQVKIYQRVYQDYKAYLKPLADEVFLKKPLFDSDN